MTRLEALKLAIAPSVKTTDWEEAKQIIAEMIAEVEGFKNVVDHALHVLHGEGCVPLVWGVAKDMLSDDDDSPEPTEEDLRAASERLAKGWDEHASEELHALVGETLHVIVSTQ